MIARSMTVSLCTMLLATAGAAAANKPIVVTSGVDNGTDGAKVTLREAFKTAAKRPGPDRIVLDPAVFSIALEQPIAVADAGPVSFDADPDDDGVGRLYAYARNGTPFFEVAPGTSLTVIGALFEHGYTVGKAGNAGEAGVWGVGGASGADHSELGDNKASLAGGSGSPGTAGLAGGPAGKGQPTGGVIVNRGSLTLVRTSFGRFYAVGGNGGLGGAGGRGGNGGYGGNGGNAKLNQNDTIDPSVKPGGAGGAGADGGAGGRGGAGGEGGDVAGAIFNDKGGLLTLVDVSFGGRSTYFGYIVQGGTAVGGPGSRGGSGGNGGTAGGGGQGGRGGVKWLPPGGWEKIPRGTFGLFNGGTYDPCLDSDVHPCGITSATIGGVGGSGARGGNAGPSGASGGGGDAAGAVLNYGKVVGAAGVSPVYKAEGGAGGDPMGYRASGGVAASGGLGGVNRAGYYFLWEYTGQSFIIRYAGDLPVAADGRDGKAGTDAAVAAKGPAGKAVAGIFTKGSGAIKAAAVGKAIAFVHDLGRGKDASGRPILSFNLIRLGDVSAKVKIGWRIRPGTTGRPVAAGDFTSGKLPSGTKVLPGVSASVVTDTSNTVRVDLPLTSAALSPAGKTYIIELLPLTETETILGTDAVKGAL